MTEIDFYLPFGAAENTPMRIVVHAMAEFLEGGDRDIYAPYFLEKMGYSAHALITPSGGVIRQRKDTQGAFHAKEFNHNSVGIEILVPGVHNYSTFLEAISKPWCTDAAFNTAVAVCKHWLDVWHIKSIDRHSDLSPGRKYDPGDGFEWQRFIQTVRS
jgi:N-acetyl-anhydromuramyl-L-alanine amidase AmpD